MLKLCQRQTFQVFALLMHKPGSVDHDIDAQRLFRQLRHAPLGCLFIKHINGKGTDGATF